MNILYANIIGQGKPLLVLHGYFGMGDNWKSLARRFAMQGFEVHLIDQRNHGRSFHSDDFDYNLMTDDLKNYIFSKALKKPCILGHSMGGKTAMFFAVKYPNLVNKLIIADISPKNYPLQHNNILRALNSVDFRLQNTRKLVDSKLSEFIPELGLRQFLLKNLYWKEKTKLKFRFNLKSLTKNKKKIGEALPVSSVFEGGALFLAAEKSNYIGREDLELIKVHFPNAEIQSIANAGHWLHAENPNDFFKKVIDFI
ncbi:MAG: alpha/beta fold hydrolase [Tenacibaculum sp.]